MVAVAIHVAMFSSLFWGYLNPLAPMTSQDPQAADFFAIRHAGASILHGVSIYEWNPSLLEGVPYYAPYRYLPFFAYSVGVFFNTMPPWTGYWLWVSLNELMLVANSWLTYRIATVGRWRWIAAGLWFVFTPLYVEEYLGQWSFLMATLMLWTAAALLRGRDGLAGAFWAASILTKTNSAILSPMFLLLRRWRTLALTGVAVVVLNVPYFIAYPDDARTFLNFNFGEYWGQKSINTLFVQSADHGGMGLARQVWLIFDPRATGTPTWLRAGLVGTVLSLSLAATFLPRSRDILAIFAAWSCVYFLVYFAWEPHYVMLLPALALLVALRPEYRGVCLVAFVLLALPTPYYLFHRFFTQPTLQQTAAAPLLSPESYWPAWGRVLQHAAKPVPVFVLWAALVWPRLALWRNERPREELSYAAMSMPLGGGDCVGDGR